MGYKKNALVIFKLTWYSLLVSLLLRIIRSYAIYYYEMSEYFSKRLKIVYFLEKFNLRWINKDYVDYSEYSRGWFLAKEFTDIVFNKTKSDSIITEINNRLSVSDSFEKKLDILWKKNLFTIIERFAHQYAVAEYLINKKNYNVATVIVFSSMASYLNHHLRENNKNIKLFILPDIISLYFLIRGVRKVGHKSLMRLLSIRRKKTQSITAAYNINKTKINVEDYQVVFFPHQGIFYGNLFVKDHFYNENLESPLHRTKILHISLHEKAQEYMSKSYKYYNENNITYLDIADLDFDKKKLLKDCFSLLYKARLKFFSDIYKYGFVFFMYLLISFLKIQYYTQVFSKFKNLKVVLVGYDFLFPLELSIAFSLLGVKVCACQERFIQAFYPQTYYIYDYYFSAGKVVNERGLKNCRIEHRIPTGLVRVDKLFEYERKQLPDKKYDSIKKNKKLVLALDYHLPSNDFEDIQYRYGLATVKNIRQFYNDLINLALEFPSLYIVIKGKFVESYKSHYISDIVERIDNMENIEIELNLEKYNPYYLGEKADLTIACHTSLADELLAAGRKVIFYEVGDYLDSNFNYDNLPIIVRDYEALKQHVHNFFNGTYLDENRINKLKAFYNNCYHGKITEKVHSVLKQLVKN